MPFVERMLTTHLDTKWMIAFYSLYAQRQSVMGFAETNYMRYKKHSREKKAGISTIYPKK
jgi:hypothetical protein